MSRWQTKTIITILSLLLILLGFAIRLHNLGRDSMWWDEIATIQIARGGLETAVQATLILYTHYSGFVVLATQMVIAAIWLILPANRHLFSRYLKMIPAVLLIPQLYLPWLPRFQAGLTYNTSEETLTGTGSSTP